MSKGFIEAFAGDEVEATEQASHEFDFDEVAATFGEAMSTPEYRDKFARALAFIMDWLLAVNLDRHHALKSIGKRAVAMAWVLDPDRFKQGDAKQSPSLSQLSKQLGFTTPAISPTVAAFSRLTGITNRYQLHDWRKEKSNPNEFTNN